jgi:hypothetical protein
MRFPFRKKISKPVEGKYNINYEVKVEYSEYFVPKEITEKYIRVVDELNGEANVYRNGTSIIMFDSKIDMDQKTLQAKLGNEIPIIYFSKLEEKPFVNNDFW